MGPSGLLIDEMRYDEQLFFQKHVKFEGENRQFGWQSPEEKGRS